MIADLFIKYTRHSTETNKVKTKRREQIGNHEWTTLSTQDTTRDKQNKNKTQKTKTAIMNGQH
jgi:hypothetical protein